MELAGDRAVLQEDGGPRPRRNRDAGYRRPAAHLDRPQARQDLRGGDRSRRCDGTTPNRRLERARPGTYRVLRRNHQERAARECIARVSDVGQAETEPGDCNRYRCDAASLPRNSSGWGDVHDGGSRVQLQFIERDHCLCRRASVSEAAAIVRDRTSRSPPFPWRPCRCRQSGRRREPARSLGRQNTVPADWISRT